MLLVVGCLTLSACKQRTDYKQEILQLQKEYRETTELSDSFKEQMYCKEKELDLLKDSLLKIEDP